MIPDPAVNIWAWTKNSLADLYRLRAAGLAQEMDCHAQAAEIYAPSHIPGARQLDAGGGSGYFYWSLKKRGLAGQYHVLDQTEDFLAIGRQELAGELPPERFIFSSIQEAPGQYQAVFCLNALFCLPDYRQGLERLLLAAEEMIIIRTPLGAETQIRYEEDEFLDPGGENLRSYFNIWSLDEICAFVRSYGFAVSTPVDRRTQDQPEISAGKIFPWRWVVGVRPKG